MLAFHIHRTPFLSSSLALVSMVFLLLVLWPPRFRPGDPARIVPSASRAFRTLKGLCFCLWLALFYVWSAKLDRQTLTITVLSVAVVVLLRVALWLWENRSALAAARHWQANHPRPAIEDEPELHQLWVAMEKVAYQRACRRLFNPTVALSPDNGPAMVLFLEEREGNLRRVLRENEREAKAWRAASAKYETMPYPDKCAMEATYRTLRRIEPQA